MHKAIIIANGAPEVGPAFGPLYEAMEAGASVICADGGADAALELGWQPSLVIGDMDSIQRQTLQVLEAQNIDIIRHPPAKDETDLELTLLEAVRRGFDWLRIVGAVGGRFDQTLANLYLLALPELIPLDARLVMDKQTIWLVETGHHRLMGRQGDTVSLIPFCGDVENITTTDMKYPLNGETLYLGPARGVSNVIAGAQPSVRFDSGRLLIVHTAGTPE